MNLPKPFTRKEMKKSSSSLKASSEQSCVDLEDLFQFEAARQRALAQKPPELDEKSLSTFYPRRIFVNQIDTFNGSHIVEYLLNLTRQPEREIEGERDGEFERTTRSEMYEDEHFVDDESEESLNETPKTLLKDTYEIFGSLEFYNNPKASDMPVFSRPEGITELLDNEKKIEFLGKVYTCGFIIYDITSDLYCHPTQVEEARLVVESIAKCLEIMESRQPKAFSKYTYCRVFILISTLLTWAKTKPIDPEDPSLPFTERDYRKRKPHPNYRAHCELEKRVIELGKKFPNHLKTIVIGSGVVYGHEEDVFHFLFKMAWQDAPFLPIFRPGTNTIPVIHVDSLASIVHLIIENFPQKYKYIIATDPQSITLKEIVKVLAKNLGNGKTKMMDKEEAFLYPDIKQRNYDMLTIDIKIVPGFIMDNMAIRWGTDFPFSENIKQMIKEFKKARNLLPIKIFVHGPPASGKTFMAKRLADYYDVPYLNEKGIIEETVNTLKSKIEAITKKNELADKTLNQEKIEIENDEAAENENEEETDNEEQEDLETLKMNLREIEEKMEANDNNKLDDDLVLRYFKEKLSSNLCKNKGYVIDGYPESMEQTKILYSPEVGEEVQKDNEEESQGEDISRLCNMEILPGHVESLDASDEFLINRVIKQPEIRMTPFEEHEMCRRLSEFRTLNMDNNTPLIFYDELEVHPMIYNVEDDPDPRMEPTFQAILDHVGPPRNYGKDLKQLKNITDSDEWEEQSKKLEELKAQKEEVRKMAEERRQNFEKWMFLKNQELEMEEKALVVMGMPLRHYLMKYVFPCLTRGLVEVARLRPDDPVDFLSEFLFRENPEGKMFQPNYEETEEKLAQAVKEYEAMLGEKKHGGSKSSKKSFSVDKSPRSDAVSRVTDYKCSLVSGSTPSSRSKGSKYSAKSKVSTRSVKSKVSTRSVKSEKSEKSSSEGVCTCRKSPSLSTCSSDRTTSTPVSCTCDVAEPCEPCEPCDSLEDKEPESCECPCV